MNTNNRKFWMIVIVITLALAALACDGGGGGDCYETDQGTLCVSENGSVQPESTPPDGLELDVNGALDDFYNSAPANDNCDAVQGPFCQ